MNTNELMVADLVYKKERDHYLPVRIIAIYEDNVDWKFRNTEGVISVNGIKPIPITAKILEANGITLLEVGDNGPATPEKHLNRYEKWFIHTTWKDTFLWYDRMADHWHLQDMSGARFHHVHELQHALRLAGLDDLADNFKLKAQ